MKLPIVAYGDPVLRKRGIDIDKSYPNLTQLIADMFETMYAAHGVGLAAPQVGFGIRLFVIDAKEFNEAKLPNFKKVFINAHIVEESGDKWAFNEGCLSIPDVREDVDRKPKIRVQYLDENFVAYDEIYDGTAARIIQHEYDHIEGKLFVDYLNPVRKRMLQTRLMAISRGQVNVEYKMKFPNSKKKR